jgi:hypothetical protein
VSVDREREGTQAFVSLANSLVDDFDVVDLLSGLTADCARLLDIASAGVLLADRRGELQVLAASSAATRNLELFQTQREQGPCLDCYHSGKPVSVADLGKQTERWPLFVEAACAQASRRYTPSRCGSRTMCSAPSDCSAFTWAPFPTRT